MNAQITQKGTEKIVCRRCGSKNYSTELKARNLVATCNDCGLFIKNIPYSEPAFYHGKYAGTPIKDILDLDYLLWAFKNWKLKPSLRDAIIKRIDTLEFISK